jgi:hypothetical protein
MLKLRHFNQCSGMFKFRRPSPVVRHEALVLKLGQDREARAPRRLQRPRCKMKISFEDYTIDDYVPDHIALGASIGACLGAYALARLLAPRSWNRAWFLTTAASVACVAAGAAFFGDFVVNGVPAAEDVALGEAGGASERQARPREQFARAMCWRRWRPAAAAGHDQASAS